MVPTRFRSAVTLHKAVDRIRQNFKLGTVYLVIFTPLLACDSRLKYKSEHWLLGAKQMRTKQVFATFAGTSLLLLAASASAQETTTYTYDAKGRVTTATRSGGPSQGATTTYTYDNADNRSNVTVANSPNGSAADPGTGATAGTTRVIVVPLNGLSVIVTRS